MTPQERKLIDELFDRLASLESTPRDPEAVQAIRDGLRLAPNALYPLVQTTLVQDEALKRADARIRELEDELGVEPGQPARETGFLDNMRDAFFGSRDDGRGGSVPTVRQGGAPAGPWRNTTGQPFGGYAGQPGGYGAAQAPGSPGGSFLGTAAATVAGVVGGALLMNSFRGMFGGQNQGQGQSAFDSNSGGSGSPWGGGASGSELARDAGVNDIGGGSGNRMADADNGSQHASLFDSAHGEDSDFGGDDFGGDFGSDSA